MQTPDEELNIYIYKTPFALSYTEVTNFNKWSSFWSALYTTMNISSAQ